MAAVPAARPSHVQPGTLKQLRSHAQPPGTPLHVAGALHLHLHLLFSLPKAPSSRTPVPLAPGGARDLGYKWPQCVAESLALHWKRIFFFTTKYPCFCCVLCLTFRREAEFFLLARLRQGFQPCITRNGGISFSPGMHAAALEKIFSSSFFLLSQFFQGSNEM